MSSTRLAGRLVRLLNMVPYFQANPRITAAEAAADLGVTPKQIEDDLNQLWMCGLPGLRARRSDRPVVLRGQHRGDVHRGHRPAAATDLPGGDGLLVALRALLDMPGVVDPKAARSAIAKIESAAGSAAAGPAAATDPVRRRSRAARVRDAVRDGRAVHLTTTRRPTTPSPNATSTRSASC